MRDYAGLVSGVSREKAAARSDDPSNSCLRVTAWVGRDLASPSCLFSYLNVPASGYNSSLAIRFRIAPNLVWWG